MNDLQMTLLITGASGIAAMIGYNWWQDYRLRKQAHERFGDTDQDPLLNVGNNQNTTFERSEPRFEKYSGMNDSDILMNTEQMNRDSHSESLHNESQVPIDKRLFTEFVIHFNAPVAPQTWRILTLGFDQINRKRIVYSASSSLGENDEPVWCKADSFNGLADYFKASVQIANRKGPLSAIEFSEVLAKLRRFAEDQNADIEFNEMKEVMVKAQALDEAAAALDILLGLHCLFPETVHESTVVDMLIMAGWKQQGHQWLLLDGGNTMMATMVIHNAPGKRLLSFSIDVPNSADPIKALGDIVTICHSMNERFGAPLMDDSGRTLNTQAIEGIYNQLTERVRHLTDSGFTPGALVTRLLFS